MGEDFSESVGEDISEQAGAIISESVGGFPRNQQLEVLESAHGALCGGWRSSAQLQGSMAVGNS
jgi:hypothetical protein